MSLHWLWSRNEGNICLPPIAIIEPKKLGAGIMQLAVIQDVFVNNLLPVLLCAASGFLLGRILHPDIKTASRMAFYIFSPCLVFVSLEQVSISGGEFGKLAVFTLAVSVVIGGLAYLFGRSLKVGRHLIASLVVASMFVNSGNYGLAATKFAFGEDALARALVCFVFGTVAVYTLGVLIASLGKLSAGQAFRDLLTVPAIYGLIAAGLVRQMVANSLVSGSLGYPSGFHSAHAGTVGLQIAEVRVWPRDRIV
jgi:predicted permease